MANIKCFKALRPKQEFVSQVAALPYDVVNVEEAREEVKDNKYSFLHVDKPEIDLEDSVDHYDKKVYEQAGKSLKNMVKNNVFIQDHKECLYIYRLERLGMIQNGLVCCCSIDDYLNDVIKKHEHTLVNKEQDRINHVKFTDAHTGPIMMAYRKRDKISCIINDWVSNHMPLYDFKSKDGVHHTVWRIDELEKIEEIIGEFSKVPSIYIADGHHRAAAAVKVGLMKREENQDYTGDEEFNFFLSVLFPSDELNILEYNRVIKDLNGFSVDDFIQKLHVDFDIIYKGNDFFKPKKRRCFSLYLEGKWYGLQAKPHTFNERDPVACLDVSILQSRVFAPILGIDDPRNDPRIDFVGGIRGFEELKRRVDSKEMKAAFYLYPTSIDELMNIADCGLVMPPKSTWFEPKLRSGIFIHTLK